ncbi:uncharacterized protein LOC142581802 [Dermacentor variabilis]|uniref:uncharacterized protein LOC142581802 n=1 Tax=Dermacentor variabilis TaxID=34621 RepID=UPI003F5B7389
MEDLTGDGGVMKKITRPGSGPVVTRHAIVTFHYNAYVKCSWTERIDSTWMRNTPHRCNLEELGVRGLQIAVQSMRRGEECHVKIAAGYGFGAQGCLPRIPPNATLVYEIALVDFTETEDDGGADIDSRLMPTDALFGAVMTSRRALLLDPTNVKALYRYAVGLRMLGEYKEAHHVQRRLLALRPQSVHVKKELLLLEGGLVELERDYEDPYETSDELDLKEAFQRLSIEQAVEPVTRSLIRQALEALTTAEPGTELSFVNIFSREDLAYINMVCWDLRLPCYDVQGGLKARRPLL